MNNYLGKELMDVWVLSIPEPVGLFVPMKCPMNSFCHKLPSTSFPQRGLERHQSRAADAQRRANKREES